MTLSCAVQPAIAGVTAPPQSNTASMHGTVILPTGMPVPQARVVVSGAEGEASTDQRGEYKLGSLTPGVHTVQITAPGFDLFEIQITLASGADSEADAVLMATPKPVEPAAGVPAAGEPANETPAAASQTTVAAQGLSVKAERGKGALYGSLSDQSGAVIQAGTAAVTGTTPATVTVNAQGRYVLNGLAPGQYHLKISAEGFAPFETDVALSADQAVEINATLLPPSQKTEVNVEANSAAEVKTEESHIEGTITEKEVVKTGLNGRNFTQLIALAPGVSNQTGQDEALVGVKGSVKYSVNGGRVEYNNFDVDGSDVLNAGLNGAESTLMVYPSLDAIQEVKVLTSNYGAMYGRSASGTVLVTTKSGTKNIHGGLYEFLRNEAFNARNYFDQTTKAPLYRRHDFGGTLGGPLFIPGVFNTRKDKTYFFWSEEFRLEKTPQEFNQAVPSAAERGIGVNCPNGVYSNGISTCADFSDVCPVAGTATIDLTLFPDCPIAAAGPAPFFNNLVPIDRTSAEFLQSGIIPLPNSSVGCNSSLAGTPNIATGLPNVPCYDAVISPSTYWREELARIDHNFTQSVRLSLRYIHDSWNTTEPTPVWGFVQNSFPTVQNRLVGPGTSMVVRLTDTLSPSLLNEFVASYVDSHITLREQPAAGVNLPVVPDCNTPTVGAGVAPCIGYIFNNGAGGKTPGLVIAGTNAAYGGNGFIVDPSYAPWNHTSPTYSLGDSVSKQLGKHTLQFGAQVVVAQRNESNGAIGAATGDLQGILTFSNQNNVTNGNAFADFLAGPNVPSCQEGCTSNAIKSYQQDSAQLKYYNDYWIVEPYLQDDWHVNRHLTVNLGLRMSLFTNFHEKNLNAWNWVASSYNPANTAGVTLAPYAFPINGGYFAQDTNNCVKNNICIPLPFDPSNPGNLNPALSQLLLNGLVQCGKNGVPDTCMSSHLFNPAPRIGFAWDPKGDGKTSIRGGYGVFFEHGTAKESNTGSLEGSSPPVLTMTAPLPFSYANIGVCSSCSTPASVAFPLDVTSIPTKTTWPYVQQWSFSVQRQLPKDSVATIAYVGSKGTHLSAELQINQLQAPPTGPDTGILPSGNPFTPGQPLTVAGDCATFQNNSFTVNGILVTSGQPAFKNMAAACFGARDLITGAVLTSIPNPNLLRPYFGFQRILSLQNVADSQYHALQTTVRRSHGPLTVGLSYTYSHSLDDSSDRSSASFVNSANIRSNWASSDFDQRHLFNFNYIYDLPKFARGFQRWFSWEDKGTIDSATASPGPSGDSKLFHTLLDGWQVSGITIFQSGTPFSVINGGSTTGISVLDNAGVANGSGSGSYPDVVASPKSALPGAVSRFDSQSIGPLLYNPAAFAAPRGLTFGDAGRNFLNNPHRLNFDMSLLKTFKITEGSNLEFRTEAFNIFNHTQFRIFNPNIGNAANNTINCYGGGLGGPYTAAGGYTILPGTTNPQPEYVDCTSGSAFLHPIDAHRPRTIQLGLKYSF